MSLRISAVIFSVLAVLGGAQAQDLGKPARLAAVDDTGRVVPVKPHPASVGRINSAFAAAGVCADAKAIAPTDARALVVRIATEEDFYPDFVEAVAKNETLIASPAVTNCSTSPSPSRSASGACHATAQCRSCC